VTTQALPWRDCTTCGQRVAPRVYRLHQRHHARVRRQQWLGQLALWRRLLLVAALAVVSVPWWVGVRQIVRWLVEW